MSEWVSMCALMQYVPCLAMLRLPAIFVFDHFAGTRVALKHTPSKKYFEADFGRLRCCGNDISQAWCASGRRIQLGQLFVFVTPEVTRSMSP